MLMTTVRDRWRDHHAITTAARPAKRAKSRGIRPSSFHRNFLDDREESTPSERQLERILRSAARSEVTQKRSQHATIVKNRRRRYRAVTSLETFPLQDLAVDFLSSLTEAYLGGIHHEDNGGERGESPNSPLQMHESSSLDNYNRKGQHEHPDGKDSLGEKQTPGVCRLPPTDSGTNELWSFEPRIFALETSTSGKRRYIVGHLGRFLDHYWRESDPRTRHFYELIREGAPCRLYFDLEFSKAANPRISSDVSEALMEEFVRELCDEVRTIHGIRLDRSCIVDLDSSTEKKFSRHLIVHLPNGELFANSCSAGAFAKRFVGRLAEEVATGALAARRAILAKHLFVNSQAPPPSSGNCSRTATAVASSCAVEETKQQNTTFDHRKATCFVDLGVYTRNRLFRLMGSTKFGKGASAALRIARANEFPFPADFGNSNFYLPDQATRQDSSRGADDSDATRNRHAKDLSGSQDHDAFCAALDWEKHARALALTLVVPANSTKGNVRVLTEPNGEQDSGKVSSRRNARRCKATSRNGGSPVLALDEFILESTCRGGVQGKIRAWSMERVRCEGTPDSWYMSYQMSHNRWCEHIGRAHRSNNIVWNVDVGRKTFWQTCHDPECRAAGFRGRARRLPEEVAAHVNEYLLDREIAELDEGAIVRGAIVRGAGRPPATEFDDEELDGELGNLDMSLVGRSETICEPDPSDFDDSEFDRALGNLDMSVFTPNKTVT